MSDTAPSLPADAKSSRELGQADQPCKQNDIPCCWQKFKVECGHGERGYYIGYDKYGQVDHPPKPKLKNDNSFDNSDAEKNPLEIHVIAGCRENDADEMTIKLEGSPCPRNQVEDPYVQEGGIDSNLIIAHSGTELRFKALCPEDTPIQQLLDLVVSGKIPAADLSKLFSAVIDPLSVPSRDYTVSPNVCEGCKNPIKICCWPEYEAKLEIEVDWGTAENLNDLTNKLLEPEKATASGSLKLGKQSEQVSVSLENSKDANPGSFLKAFFDIIDALLKVLGQESVFSAEFKLPVMRCGVSGQTREIDQYYKLDFGYEFYLQGEPFLGWHGKIDILISLLRLGIPGFGYIAEFALQMARKNGQDCSVDLLLKGEIAGGFKWTFASKEKADASAEGSVKPSLALDLEVKLGLDWDNWGVKTKAGVEGSASFKLVGELKATEAIDGQGLDPVIEASLGHGGLMLKGAVYVRAGMRICSVEEKSEIEYALIEPKPKLLGDEYRPFS